MRKFLFRLLMRRYVKNPNIGKVMPYYCGMVHAHIVGTPEGCADLQTIADLEDAKDNIILMYSVPKKLVVTTGGKFTDLNVRIDVAVGVEILQTTER